MSKKVIKLNISHEDQFQLIGISSHENDYRLSWAINEDLGIELKRTSNYTLFNKKLNSNIEFTQYEYQNETTEIKFLLISNRSETGILIPEHKNIDYFLVLVGLNDGLLAYLQKVKAISIISLALPIDISTLKSKKNLVF